MAGARSTLSLSAKLTLVAGAAALIAHAQSQSMMAPSLLTSPADRVVGINNEKRQPSMS